MRLMYGSLPRPFYMSSTQRYDPDELERRAIRLLQNQQPLYLRVENHNIRLAPEDIRLAVAVVASYHNQICYNIPANDFWDEDTAQMEAAAKARMDATSSGDDSG